MASIARSSLLRQVAPVSRSLAAPTRASPALRSLVPAAAFHTSSRRSILPPGPQTIEGTVNDPAPVPPSSPSHGHYHWTFERLLAAGLVPLTVAPFAAGSLNPALDAVLAAGLLLHSHMGFQSIVIDYVPKRRFPGGHRFAVWALNAATVVVGIGLYEFETTDVGLVETVKRIWKA